MNERGKPLILTPEQMEQVRKTAQRRLERLKGSEPPIIDSLLSGQDPHLQDAIDQLGNGIPEDNNLASNSLD